MAASAWSRSAPALHFFICIVAAAVLYFVVSRVKFLPRNWLLLAVIHGIAVLLTMNYVILPLSAIGQGIYPLETGCTSPRSGTSCWWACRRRSSSRAP